MYQKERVVGGRREMYKTEGEWGGGGESGEGEGEGTPPFRSPI